MLGSSMSSRKAGLIALTVLGLFVLATVGCVTWLVLPAQTIETARDYEECVAASPKGMEKPVERSNAHERGSLAECSARFAGRRKSGGGYTYYDFMQDRSFDIAGPNPSIEERNYIDREYIGFLDLQHRERVSEALAKQQDQDLRLELEKPHAAVGPPLVLTPKAAPSSVGRRVPDQPKPQRCEDNLLACSWTKFSSAVKDAFASSRGRP
jgi:hypothetical protein